ncbi:hypothetical protein B6U99_04970 [Candidatus Geothermarchaeota archaeon ex4572_27]|nr:MAG: hypothetical protein B6U99_04970 [Candidatus Geothermarchaeota archaeon ex4572_27]
MLEAIYRKCHCLVIPDVESEHRVHIGEALLSFIVHHVYRRLGRSKFKHPDKPPSRAPRDVEEGLRQCGAKRGDLTVARVAWKRSRGRKALIVSNDPALHNALPKLRAHGIEVLHVDDFLEEVREDV